MLCWSHTATSNTSSGLEPTGSAVALHHSKQLKDVENRWSMDYQDLPCRLCGLFVIVVQSEMCVCMCFGGGVLHLVPCYGSVHACYEGAEFVIAASLKWVGAGGRNGSGRIGRQL